MLRLGYVLARYPADRRSLAAIATQIKEALKERRTADLRTLVGSGLGAEIRRTQQPDLLTAVTTVAAAYVDRLVPETLPAAWAAIDTIAATAGPLLQSLLANASAVDPTAAAGSMQQRRANAAAELATYLRYLGKDQWPTGLLDLHVVVRSVLPVLVEVEQPVQLVQVSADTRTLLDPQRRTAASKLTGLQMHHFGAFYKATWRANDWMWGRLDGCGWLVHVLLDPRRVIAVLENDEVEPAQRVDRSSGGCSRHWGANDAGGGRTVARVPGRRQGRGADQLAGRGPVGRVGAAGAHRGRRAHLCRRQPRAGQGGSAVRAGHVVARDLRRGQGHGRPAGQSHRDGPHAGRLPGRERDPRIAGRLAALPADPHPHGGRRHLRRHAMKSPPASLRPTFATARSITQTAYVATDQTHGKRQWMTLAGVAGLVVGVLAMLEDSVWFGLPGLVLFGTGALLLAFCVGNGLPRVVTAALAFAVVLLAAAPWLPYIDSRFYSWLLKTLVPWLHRERWVWPAFVLVLLLPPAMSVVGVRRQLAAAARKRRADAAHHRPSPRPSTPMPAAPKTGPPPSRSPIASRTSLGR